MNAFFKLEYGVMAYRCPIIGPLNLLPVTPADTAEVIQPAETLSAPSAENV